MPQFWRRCVGCCVVVTVQKKNRTKSVFPKKMSRERICLHYGFNLFEKQLNLHSAFLYSFWRRWYLKSRCCEIHFARISREAAALDGVKWWPRVQTYPVQLFESCGIAKLAGIQGHPKFQKPELSLGSLLFEILKNPRRHDNQPVRPWSALSIPVAGKSLWDQGAQEDVAANL